MTDAEFVDLIAALVAAASEAHTRRTWLRRIADVLAQWLPLERLELGELVDGELELLTAPHGAPVTSARQPLAGDPATALQNKKILDRSDSRHRRLHIPLGDPPTQLLHLRLRAAARADLLTSPRLATLAQIFHHLLHSQDVTQRVAEVARRAHAENRILRDERRDPDAPFVAAGPAMQAVLARLDAVARFATPVLLLGESGTGKELLAQRLHRQSPRAHRALVTINCGALPPQLVESALFGHEAGAFTGASKRHRGVFERADRGTLFLDEVGELPLAVQVKLLRVLQSQEFERVGGETPIKVDVRVVAATHRALEPMVEQGAFRRDLYYRLCVFPIAIPPLRDRPEELPALTAALLAEIAARLGLPAPRVAPKLLSRLRQHPWPGNVRELANVLESAMILGRGDILGPADVLLAPVPQAPAPGPERLADATRRCITTALAACHGKIYGPDGAAAVLGLNPATLQSKLRVLGLDRLQFVREGDPEP